MIHDARLVQYLEPLCSCRAPSFLEPHFVPNAQLCLTLISLIVVTVVVGCVYCTVQPSANPKPISPPCDFHTVLSHSLLSQAPAQGFVSGFRLMFFDCVVQNPVTTALWLVACCQIITPMFSFSVDCAPFCNSHSRPDVVMEVIYVALVSIACMLGPYMMFRGLGSYFDLPFTYRYKAYAINVSGAVTYAVALKCTRLLLIRHQRRVVAGGT